FPGTNYMDIAAGDQHSVALRTDGTLIAMGLNSAGQTTVPAGNNYTMISAGYRHNLALRSDGSIATWGYSSGGLGNVPTVGTFIDISAGRDFSVALKANTTTQRGLRLKAPKARLRLK
ncbi:MAG: RCC1 domain-containing protein, partial [Candidatus Cloacimonadaceae bacterium]